MNPTELESKLNEHAKEDIKEFKSGKLRCKSTPRPAKTSRRFSLEMPPLPLIPNEKDETPLATVSSSPSLLTKKNRRFVKSMLVVSSPLSPISSSTSSSTSSMTIDSPLSSPKVVVTVHPNDKISAQTTHSFSDSSSASREKLIYKPYKNGVMNENRMPFDNVSFCFSCDKQYWNRKSSIVMGGSRSDSPRRRRATSVTDGDCLQAAIVVTGNKFSPDGDGGMIPVYRRAFLCPVCYDLVVNRDPPTKLKFSKSAMSYF